MAEYGVYTLMEIYTQIFGSAPSSASELATVRSYIKGLGGIPVSKTNLNQYYMPNDFFAKATYTGSQALTVPSSTASSAWGVYKDAQGAISQLTGGATQGGELVKSAEIGYFRFPDAQSPTGSLYKPAALLKMPLPSVAAAVAPLAGVAIGVDMYRESPELWTKLSRALLPWAYPDDPAEGLVDVDKGLMPVWTEVAEAGGELIAKALIPAPIVDAIKGVFEEEGVGTKDIPEGSATWEEKYPGATIYTGDPVVTRSDLGTITVAFGNSGNNIAAYPDYGVTPYVGGLGSPIGIVRGNYSTVVVIRNGAAWNSTAALHTTIDGVIYSIARIPVGGGSGYSYSPPMSNVSNTNEIIDILYNGGTAPSPYYYPTGTSQWGDGSSYVLPANPTQIVLQNPDDTEHLVDAYPIPLPLTPGQSTDPNVQGIDDPLIDITKQVDPYIQETPDPYGTPSPSPNPPGQPDPRTDPSQDGEPTNPISPSSPTPDPPPSDGESPDPTPPIIPTPFTSSGGLIAVYNPSQSILVDFANWLWVTYQDATIQKIWNNPFDGVISLHELYCTPPVIGSRNIKSGFLDSEIGCPIISRYTEINCGSVVIPEYWANYLDYAPYSKAFVYLPFIGIIELEADDIVGHSVNITYRIDCYNGSCIAMITVAKQGPDGSVYNNTVYQYSGNCAVEVPLTGGTQAAIKAAVMNATALGLGSVVSGLAGALTSPTPAGQFGAIGQAVQGLASAVSAVTTAKSSVQHSGSFGASFGAMGIKNPYIIVKRPIQVQVLNYNEIYGYQAHKAVTIGSCEGYLRCREVHVTSATANDEEKQLIEQYLKTGVIV